MGLTVDQLVQKIPDGCKIAVPADYAGIAMEATRALVRRGAKDLHIVGVPISGLQSELLIGAGCVATYESSALSLGEYNPAPRFSAAVKEGSIRLIDATCPAIHAGLQASQKGIPFMPLRGILGTDTLEFHPHWKVINNPCSNEEDPIVVIPAIRPDVALFHAPAADRDGNIWVGRRKELVHMSQASKMALVTVEEIVDDNFLEDEKMAAGTIPALYVGGVAKAPHGTWPLSFWNGDAEDSDHLKHYQNEAKTDEGFKAYIDEFVFSGERS